MQNGDAEPVFSLEYADKTNLDGWFVEKIWEPILVDSAGLEVGGPRGTLFGEVMFHADFALKRWCAMKLGSPTNLSDKPSHRMWFVVRRESLRMACALM